MTRCRNGTWESQWQRSVWANKASGGTWAGRDAIEAHLTIVFTALAVSREAQNRTGIAIRNLVRQLRPLRSATIAINGAQQTFPPALSDSHREILQALKDPAVTH